MTRCKALCLNFGEMVWLEWSELANDEAMLRQANDKMLHLTLNGFKYYVAADDYEKFVQRCVDSSRFFAILLINEQTG